MIEPDSNTPGYDIFMPLLVKPKSQVDDDDMKPRHQQDEVNIYCFTLVLEN